VSDTEFEDEAAAFAARLDRLVTAAAVLPACARRRRALPLPFSNMTREHWVRSIELWKQHGLGLLHQQPARPCPACGDSDADPLFHSYDGHPYVECRTCRTWYVPLVVDYGLYQRYFELVPEARRFGDYTQAQVNDEAAMAVDAERFDGYYAELAGMAGAEHPTTLDIGCGVGNSLVWAERHGFEAIGVEINQAALATAARLKRPVFALDAELPIERFDVVTLWETLEHLADPLSALQEAAGRVRPGGVLAITVPNLDSPSIRSMRGTRTAYGASKAALNSLAEGIRSDVHGTPIAVSTILPGYIATDINVGRRGPFTVDLDTGVDALTAAIEREPVRAYVPGWPWRPVAGLLRVLPLPVLRRVT